MLDAGCDETKVGGKDGLTDDATGGKRRDEQRKELGKRSVKEMGRTEIGCEIIFFMSRPLYNLMGMTGDTFVYFIISHY